MPSLDTEIVRVGAMNYLGQLSPLEPRILLTASCAAFYSPTAPGASQFGTCDQQCVRSGGRDGLSHGWNYTKLVSMIEKPSN